MKVGSVQNLYFKHYVYGKPEPYAKYCICVAATPVSNNLFP